MKTLLALSAAVLAAGCATTEPTQVAQAECKIAPITTRSMTYGARKPESADRLDVRQAQMQAGSTQYRQANLRALGIDGNLLEEAMRDCDRALANQK